MKLKEFSQKHKALAKFLGKQIEGLDLPSAEKTLHRGIAGEPDLWVYRGGHHLSLMQGDRAKPSTQLAMYVEGNSHQLVGAGKEQTNK